MKAFIFDLDGVLVFTDHFHYLAWKTIADKMGIYFDEAINNRLRGVSRMDSLEIILQGYKGAPLSIEEKEKLAAIKNKAYKKYLETMIPADVAEDIRSTLAQLHKDGYLLAVGSSSKNARFILEKVNLLDQFDAISDGNNILKSKPDPEVFVKAAEYLNVEPEQCAVVEDAYAGIDAAKAGNMTAVAIGEATSYNKADIRLKHFSDLLNIEKCMEEVK